MTTEPRPIAEEPTIERGLIGAFRFFIAIRLVLWRILYRTVATSVLYAEFSSFAIQALWIMFLPDLLMLIVLSWPRLYRQIDQRHFRWIVAFSTAALLIGHANLLPLRDLQNLPHISAYLTPHMLCLFITVLFVGWQYHWRAVLFYSAIVAGMFLVSLWQLDLLTPERFGTALVMVNLVILLPGWVTTRMMTQQRQQKAALATAAEEQARTNKQLVHYTASLEELTISRERNRLARELHDTLAHSLSAVTVQLGAVETLWESNPEAAKTLLTQADESARTGLDEARRALQALRALPLEDLGLVLALEALAKEATERTGSQLHLDVPEEKLTFLEPHIEQSIYRVAQEALENCVRHAEAKTLWVTLVHSVQQLQLTIQDDGQGFDQSQSAPTGHYGVAGMNERASVIGGTLQIESVLGEGTTVQLVVLLREIKGQ
ncbi:MAG: sensor histidine kinase [Chloroflexota bacterium]